jgi:metal-responsive CopG/Arc/MetJ family transcriptional regulator
MPKARITIALDARTLRRLDGVVAAHVYPSRSQAIQAAVDEKLDRLERTRFARECAKLDPAVERAMTEEGVSEELATWPIY